MKQGGCLVAVLTALLLPILLLVVLVAGGVAACESQGAGTLKDDGIPAKAAEMYQAMAERWDISVAFLASIGAQECDHGRCGDLNQINSSGCVGWMQLGVGGACGDYWGTNKCDGNGDGKMEVLEPWDNICASAKGIAASLPDHPTAADYRQAACRYYGACADRVADYANEIMDRAGRYGFSQTDSTLPISTEATEGCPQPAGGMSPPSGNGTWRLAPGANARGVELTADMQQFLSRMAGYLPRTLVVCTGTNHSYLTASNNVSDHWDGNAADICSSQNGFTISGEGGTRISTAAFRAAGLPYQQAAARARAGGIQEVYFEHWRVQIIWLAEGHYDHVHVGIKRVDNPRA